MDITKTLEDYKLADNYFAPEYEGDNSVLTDFVGQHPTLSKLQTEILITLLSSNDNREKYFVADLLYLYKNFPYLLMLPMLKYSHTYNDPSLNRIFLKPCIESFGLAHIEELLVTIFKWSGLVERIGIARLRYWIRGEVKSLDHIIVEHSKRTSNVVELYHYNLQYSRFIDNHKIPTNAVDLMRAVKGNKDYEELLFDTLGWHRLPE